MAIDVRFRPPVSRAPADPLCCFAHAAQFYREDEALLESVGVYLGVGLACGEGLVVIATDAHQRGLIDHLKGKAIDVVRARSEGRVVIVNAETFLSQVMVDGAPDPDAFEQLLGPLMDGAGTAEGRRSVRAYGEIGDLLRQAGQHCAAIRMESLWSTAAETRRLSLLCAYRTEGDGQGERSLLHELSGRHTHVLEQGEAIAIDGLAVQARELGFLEQRTRALENEVRQRARLEGALRDALAERGRLLAEAQADRARLVQSEERQSVQRRRLELLQSLTTAFAKALDPVDIAALIVHEGTEALEADSGGLWLHRPEGGYLELVRSTGLSPDAEQRYARLPLDSNLPIAACHATRAEVCLESRAAFEEACPEPASELFTTPDFSVLYLPLAVEQRCFGAFSVAFNRARFFSAEERSFLTALAYHAAQALERARLFAEAERIGASLRFVSEASGILAGSLDYDATLSQVARLAVPRIADGAWIDMLGPDRILRRVAMAHTDQRKADVALEISRRRAHTLDDRGGPALVIRTGKAEMAGFASATNRASSQCDEEDLNLYSTLGVTSWMCVPLVIAGKPGGAMTFVSSDPRRGFGESDLALAEELARRASMAIDNARAYREAREANRVKDDFLATMSHELRTPLNAILGWAAMLRARPDVDFKKAIATIERNARAQVRLIEEVLDVSRIMTGKLKLDPKPTDLATVLRASIDVVAPSAIAKGIAITADIQVEPCPFFGDAGRLQQVVWNLLSNAIKFTPKGGRVDIRLSSTGATLQLSVKDTGRGVRSDFLPVMFQRFRQADSSTTRTEGGLGIGLAIAGHIVELHGGTITAYSAGEGCGATFTITLPIGAVRVEQSRASAPSAKVRKPLTGLRVLICEDDADSRELLKEVLSGEGATVVAAAAAAEALERLRVFRPDVFVSDIGLPLVDGYALMRQVRDLSVEEGGRTPAIALTAYAGIDDARKAFAAGYQLHVAKPVDPTDLAARVALLAGRLPEGALGDRPRPDPRRDQRTS
jgi:signal transduction histidine kinase/CheY-like chemotaxis protein